MSKKDQILKLRSEGKTYDEIIQIVGCSKGTVSYHCGEGQKAKNLNRTRKKRSIQHPFVSKIESFSYIKYKPQNKQPIHKTKKLIQLKLETFFKSRETGKYIMPNFTVEDIINKVTEKPICYLTGEQIDINSPRTYNFDHIIPVSRGGNNTLDNLGICTKQVNSAKSDMTPDEFINLCKKVLIHNGYNITK